MEQYFFYVIQHQKTKKIFINIDGNITTTPYLYENFSMAEIWLTSAERNPKSNIIPIDWEIVKVEVNIPTS